MSPITPAPVQLIVIVDEDHQEAFFFLAGRRSRELSLTDSTGEEEYFIGDNPIPESLVAWTRFEICENEEGKKSFGLRFRSNVVDVRTVNQLGSLQKQMCDALEAGESTNIDLGETLASLGWAVSLP